MSSIRLTADTVHAVGTPDLKKILETLHNLQRTQPDRFEGLGYKIQKRGYREDARVKNFFSYDGPDKITRKLLDGCAHSWAQSPQSFWQGSTAVRLGHPIALSVEDILATIRAMIDWGHRYKNMEAALGEGICMVLGRRLKESYWKKLMGKSGPRFKRVVLQLQNTDAASLSTQHASLCKLIVQTRVQQLRPSLLCLRSQATTPMLYAPALLSPQAAYREAYEEMYDWVASPRLTLHGLPSDQLKAVKSLKTSQRYRKAFATRSAVQSFADKLRKDGQPYQRVRDLVETVRREHADAGIMEFSLARSELQLRERLQAISLLIRCDIIIFSDVIDVNVKTIAARARGDLHLDFANNRSRCDELVKESEETYSIRQEVERRLFWARFAAMKCGAFDYIREEVPPGATAQKGALNEEVLKRLKQAQNICERFLDQQPDPTEGLIDEIKEVRKMLNEGVSTSEMKMVVAAMAREFRGTGHWYRCANGHPFTVGECGMPMQLARCPDCGTGIGGQDHQATRT
ncbi:hypothetical protein LTR10_011117 [Elasticomyces elasticus]|nr:hypothetical protein LTR10_011117 [Elasticomyces elasticus]